MTDTVAKHIDLIREQLLTKGWKSNKTNLNMRNGSGSIEFDKLNGPNGPSFDINLFSLDTTTSNRFMGSVFAYDNSGQPRSVDKIVHNIISSFPSK